MSPKSELIESEEAPTFFPATVEIITCRKVKTVWHLVSIAVTQSQPNRSQVTLEEPTRLESANSGVKAVERLTEIADASASLAVIPPGEGSPRYQVVCPTHGLVRQNSSLAYAAESAYWHALEAHDA